MTAWQWDATAATVRSDSGAVVAKWLTYCGTLAYFAAEIGYAEVREGTPVYPVRTSGQVGAMDSTLYVPVGTRTGTSADHHLCIVDRVRGRMHDLWHATFDPNGRLYTWRGGSSMPLDAVTVPKVAGKTHQGATAAMMPLARGAVSPADVRDHVLHPLVFACKQPGPAPNPWPSGSQVGYANPGHIPLGTWLRMSPTATVSTAASVLERYVFDCLKHGGMFLRDQSSYSVGIPGLDPGGGGQSLPAWKAAGVTPRFFNPDGSIAAGVVKLSGIPWAKLQALQPPPKV